MTTEPSPHRSEDPAMPSRAALREPDASTLPGPDPLRNRIRHISATGAAQSRVAFRLRGRSLLVFAFTPELPIAGWLSELDRWLRQSQGFFAGRPVVLDLSGVKLTKYDFAGLIAELEARSIRLMGIEGADPSWLGPGLPPLLKGGRTAGGIEVLDPPPPGSAAVEKGAPKPQATSLLLDGPVRSGQ